MLKDCPRCGTALEPLDDNGDTHCSSCGMRVIGRRTACVP